MSVLKLVGTVLPAGEQQELHLSGGLVVDRPTTAEVTTVHTGGWIVPGLVDAHCHIGLDQHGAVDRETQEQQAIADREAGALLVRDAGSAADPQWVYGGAALPEKNRARR